MRLFSFIFILIFRQRFSLFPYLPVLLIYRRRCFRIAWYQSHWVFLFSLASSFYFLHVAFLLLLSLSIIFLSFIDFLDSFFIDRIALTTSSPQRFSLSFVQLHPIKTDSETFELNTFKFTDRWMVLINKQWILTL